MTEPTTIEPGLPPHILRELETFIEVVDIDVLIRGLNHVIFFELAKRKDESLLMKKAYPDFEFLFVFLHALQDARIPFLNQT